MWSPRRWWQCFIMGNRRHYVDRDGNVISVDDLRNTVAIYQHNGTSVSIRGTIIK